MGQSSERTGIRVEVEGKSLEQEVCFHLWTDDGTLKLNVNVDKNVEVVEAL